MESWREELYLSHHGIFGQKWGKRNGPPYPLEYSDHSAAEKNKNPKSKLDNYSEGDSKNKKKSNDSNVRARSSVKKMTNEELRAAIERKRKEKEYIELSSRDITQGRDYVDSLLVSFGTTTVNTFVKTLGAGIGAKSGKLLSDALFSQLSKKEKKVLDDTISKASDDIQNQAKKAKEAYESTVKNESSNNKNQYMRLEDKHRR